MAMNETEIIATLKQIVSSMGMTIWTNHARANAFISDFFSGESNAKTRKLLKSIIEINAFTVISSASNNDLDNICISLKKKLVDEESLSEDRAEMALSWVCGALGRKQPNYPKPVRSVQPIQPAQITKNSTSSSGSTSFNHSLSSNSSSSSSKQTMNQPYPNNPSLPNTYGLNLNHHIKRKRKVNKKLIGWTITVLLIGALMGLVVWPKLIYPNLQNKDLYTPEIVQTYSGSYTSKKTQGDAIITIASCDKNGKISGTFEFFVENIYGKYEISGQIKEKKNNGDLILTIDPEKWIIHPEDFSPLVLMTVNITDNYQSFKCSEYNIDWSVGGNDEYSIKTVDDLKKLSGSSGTYQLMNDLDLSGVNWKPIDDFEGTLLGNGYTIKNLEINSSASNVGFFSILKGAVKDLKFENANITVSGRQENIGVLCGNLSGIATGITATGFINAERSANVGGIIGYASTSNYLVNLSGNVAVSAQDRVGGVIGCWEISRNTYSNLTGAASDLKNSGKIVGTGDYVGGIIGWFQAACNGSFTINLESFENTGKVEGKTYVGGLIGYGKTDSNDSYIRDSSNASMVTAEAYVGCIAGYLSGVTVDNCSNKNSVLNAMKYVTNETNKDAFVGGYVGCGDTIKNCTNFVDVLYTSEGRFVGGLMGYSFSSKKEFDNLKNIGNISGKDYVGGIFGCWEVSLSTYSNCSTNVSILENDGDVTGNGDYVGGTFGAFYASCNGSYTVYFMELKNTGNVQGKLYVGGLIGYGDTDSHASFIRDSSNSSSVKGEAYVGCIAGYLSDVMVDNCSNQGSQLEATQYVIINSQKEAFVGGFVGYGDTITNCTNTVNVHYYSEGQFVGGLMGYSCSSAKEFQNLKNTASVIGADYVGGVFGCWEVKLSTYSTCTTTVNTIENNGNVSASGEYVGGVFGSFYASCNGSYTVYLSDLMNTGKIEGQVHVGGLVGYAYTDSNKSILMDSTSTGSVKGEETFGKLVGETQNLIIQ